MSRIRSIHPGFFTDEDLVAVSMAARLLILGLGVEADDKGIFEWKPLTIKMRVFPADNVEVVELLDELLQVGALRKYEVDGRFFGAIRNFRRFQKPKTPNDIHPAPSEILAFVGLTVSETDGADEQRISEKPAVKRGAFPPNGEKPRQMEDGGWRMEEHPDGCSARAAARGPKSKPPSRPVKTTIPSDWAPERFGEGTKSRRIVDGWPPGKLETEIERFVAYHTTRANRFDNWQAAWRTWVLNSEEFGHGRQTNGTASHPPKDGFQAELQRRSLDARAQRHAGEDRRPDIGDAGSLGDGAPARLAAGGDR